MKKTFILAAVIYLVVIGHSFSNVIDVDSGQSIQSAINAAGYGDTVRVAAGTYAENVALKSGVSLMGADPEMTVIDGGQNGSVVTAIGCDPNTALDGFTITNGGGAIDISFDLGGGVNFTSSVLTVSNCIFSMNSAHYGGGLYGDDSHVVIQNCRFLNNIAEFGGAIYCYDSSVEITNSHFIANTAHPLTEGSDTTVLASGGAFCCLDSGVEITDCIFINNEASDAGGAMVIAGPFDYQVVQVQDLFNCIFAKNTSGSHGGAVAVTNGAYPYFINCTLAENQVTGTSGRGGAVICISEDISQGDVFCTDVLFENSILWNNHAAFGSQAALGGFDNPDHSYLGICLSYTNIQGGIEGVYIGEPLGNNLVFDLGGNLDIDPLFVDPNGLDGLPGTADDNFHLQPWSSCIDAGTSQGYPFLPQDDIDGQTRNLYDTVDMGADEVFPIAGDIDADGDVDLEDFGYFAGHWLKGRE